MGIFQARILEWVAKPFSRGSSQSRDQTQISHIAGGFFTILATHGSPRILEWVAYPFSRGTSQPRNQTRVSCLENRFFASWATQVAQWMRICLPVQGTWVQSLVQEDSTCPRATKPVHHNYWAHAVEPMSSNYWVLSPGVRAWQWEAPSHCN